MEVAHIVTRRAEQQRGLRLVEAQQVDDRMFDVRRCDGDRLIRDVAVPAILAHSRDAQGIALILLGKLDDRTRQRGREQQRLAVLGRFVEQRLEIVAKAHVEHLVRLVEHGDLDLRQIERAALGMIAEPTRRADDDMSAVAERAALARGIHAADARRDPSVGASVQPRKFFRDLQRQLARRRDHQRLRQAGGGKRAIGEQMIGHREPERDRLARPRLRGDEQVAAMRFGFDDGRLNRGELGISARVERIGEEGRQSRKGHERLKWG